MDPSRRVSMDEPNMGPNACRKVLNMRKLSKKSKNDPKIHNYWSPSFAEFDNIWAELGRGGSEWADTLGKWSPTLQEGF